MDARTIQGFFIGGRPRVPEPVAQPETVPRPAGPPVPGFGARPRVAQLRGPATSFRVDAGSLGLVNGAGRPLPQQVRSQMESALGADFSGVRVHVGPQAERIGAIAFTMGADIYFAPGRFQPDTALGCQLLGHELAHVVQQRQGRVRNPLGAGIAVVQDRALDRDRRAAIGGVELRRADTGTAELCNLRVSEGHRKQGVGSALVRKAVNTAYHAGARSVVLEARSTDQTIAGQALVSMYQQLGFRRSGQSAAGDPVMQRATGRDAIGIATTGRSSGSRILQRMEALTTKPSRGQLESELQDLVEAYNLRDSNKTVLMGEIRLKNDETNRRGKKPPPPHFVTWFVPNTNKWMLIFVTPAAETLVRLKQNLCLGGNLIRWDRLRIVMQNVQEDLLYLSHQEKKNVIASPTTNLLDYLSPGGVRRAFRLDRGNPPARRRGGSVLL
jgi:ribosomal protein S18 acetylase RimI-like enzyme